MACRPCRALPDLSSYFRRRCPDLLFWRYPKHATLRQQVYAAHSVLSRSGQGQGDASGSPSVHGQSDACGKVGASAASHRATRLLAMHRLDNGWRSFWGIGPRCCLDGVQHADTHVAGLRQRTDLSGPDPDTGGLPCGIAHGWGAPDHGAGRHCHARRYSIAEFQSSQQSVRWWPTESELIQDC